MQQLLQQPLGLAAVALCLVPIHRIAWRRGRGIVSGLTVWGTLKNRLRKKMDMDGQGYNDI